MQTDARNQYLTNDVLTAPPQKLQLMLIDAAIRCGQQTVQLWDAQQDEAAGEALVRCQQIVSELLCGLQPDQDRDLVRRVASVYVYVFRALSAAHVHHDAQLVRDAISVLEVERETWQQVCTQLGTSPVHRAPAADTPSVGSMSLEV